MQTINEEDAFIHLKNYIDTIPFFYEASLTRLPDIDVLDYYAFSLMPKATGRMGEVTYLINGKEILSSGQPDHLEKVMEKIMKKKLTLSIHIFVKLFLRMKVLRYGVVLEKADGHALIKPGQLPANLFEPPLIEKKTGEINYRFWLFDTDRKVPVYYNIIVNEEGKISYTIKEIKD